MSYSHTFKWAIAVLILLTIGWKIAIPPDDAIDLKGVSDCVPEGQ